MIFLQVYELLWKCLPQKWHGMSEAWPSFVSVIQLFRSDPEMYSCFFTSHLNSQWQKLWFQWWITIKWHDNKTYLFQLWQKILDPQFQFCSNFIAQWSERNGSRPVSCVFIHLTLRHRSHLKPTFAHSQS